MEAKQVTAIGSHGQTIRHQAVFASNSKDRVILNIGGIASITILPPATVTLVSGFDTGAGNSLMDNWTQTLRQTSMDINDDRASRAVLPGPLVRQQPEKVL